MELKYAAAISVELGIDVNAVENTIRLFNSGATIPFIARYRKEWTGSLDEVKLAAIRDRAWQMEEMDKRRSTILDSIREQDKLTPELETQILTANSMSELEDLYLPYRPKRKTRASNAIERGLEPLAKKLMAQYPFDILVEAGKYLNEEKGVCSADEALAGARDIIAEWINENAYVRKRIRWLFQNEAVISSRIIKGKETEGDRFSDYFNWNEGAIRAPSHRILAMMRGENENILRLTIGPDEDKALQVIEKITIKSDSDASLQMRMAVKDCYKRLLQPSMETEFRNVLKEKADREAIRIFAENLRQLLLASPLGQKRVLAIDPGFRTGCKVVCLDAQGNLLHNETIYPHPPQSDVGQAIRKITSLVNAYKIEAISIGNGTASRQTENFIRRIRFDRDLTVVVVNEAGASVYSASAVAREEFPDYDVTVRGAVSIGRRLIDPLAELVKIDPKSIGVGQYQHDVDQKQLQTCLEQVVENCVNMVGVEVNTASKELLTYVSGVGPALALNIVKYRASNGAFSSREELKKVPRFGDKAFEQAAGFLRIQGAVNPLDNSAVHPESYRIVDRMAATLSVSVDTLIIDKNVREKINLHDFVDDRAGIPTLTDIVKELEKPGRDPRQTFDYFSFDPNIHEIEDLKQGMILWGIVTNITAFGAFVDVGVHQDGLVHVSQMASRYVTDPNTVVKINQKVRVKVLDVDLQRRRIQLSMKDLPAE